MKFIALEKAKEAAALTVAGFEGVGGAHRDLKDQATRAAVSAVLNLAESSGFVDGNKARHRASAYGSAKEAKVAIELALLLGVGTKPQLQAAHDALDEVAAMCWRLMRR
jgi:four helix bundle protein